MQNKMNVVSEFAKLKKVVVAQSEIIFPEKMDVTETSFLATDTFPVDVERQDLQQLIGGKSLGEVSPEVQMQWEKERTDLIEILSAYGVEVVRPRCLTDFEKYSNKEYGISNFFVRDPFFTIGNMMIEGSLRFPHRRHEILPVRDILMGHAENAMYIATPCPDISNGYDAEEGPFLEGGDVLVWNKQVFVGNSGLASNTKGYLWLKNLIEPMGYTVTEVKLLPNVLHLDCAMSFVREGLMIVSEEALLEGIPVPLMDWEKIVVKPEEIAYLAINGLPISEEVYITDFAFKESIGKALEQRGIKVEYVNFAVSRSFGGAFRCSTQALIRQ